MIGGSKDVCGVRFLNEERRMKEVWKRNLKCDSNYQENSMFKRNFDWSLENSDT